MSAAQLVRWNRRSTSHHILVLRRSWAQAHSYESGPSLMRTQQARHMSIFQEFSNRLRGELEQSPELQKTIKEVKERTGFLKNRTKETTQRICKHAGAAQEQVGAKANQVSALLKEKVHEAKERVTIAATQLKETVGILKSSGTVEHEGRHAESGNGEPSAHLDRDVSTNAQAATNMHNESQPQGGGSSIGTILSMFSKGLQVMALPVVSLFEKAKSTTIIDVARGGYNLFIEELTSNSSKRARAKNSVSSSGPRSSSTAVVPIITKKSRWEKSWDKLKEKALSRSVYKRFRGVKEHPVVVKSQEVAEDIRERWETSDSPIVHKIQDLNDSLFGETATAVALKEIRQRDPWFSFPEFLAEVQEGLQPVLQAYLKGDIEELQRRCSREVVDRCSAERRAYESQGIFFDNKILHISDVQLKETKLMGNVPIIIISFQTQQVYCVRDKHGKITQGAQDDIHTVFYAWAMQQVINEELRDGDIFPRWQLREMQQLGIQAII